MKIPFLGGSYEGRSTNVASQDMINYFYEKNIDGESLVSTPGSTVLVTPKAGEVRGGLEYNDLAYFVVGNTFYEVNSAGTATSRGTLNTSSGPVSMAHNGFRTGAKQQIMIVDGTDAWTYDNTTSTLSLSSSTTIAEVQASISAVTTGESTTTFTTSAAHGFSSGWTVRIEDMVDDGPDGDMETMFNDNSYVITVVTTTTFTVAVNSSALTNAWASAGTATREAVDISTTSVVFIDGYFLLSQTDTDRFWLTGLYDGTTIDPSDFATAEGDPDRIQALIADQRELFMFGERTLEVWYNSGDTDNTFQRFQGGFKQTGCVAKFSPARVDNNIYWLSRDERGQGQVVKLGEGYAPSVVSSPAIAYQISTYSKIDDAFGYAYQHEGHEFYVITFPTAKVTWVYDASTQEWHKRGHTIDSTFPNRERYNCHVFAFGEHLFGDFSSGAIYKLDSTVGTIDSTRIPRERTSATIGEEESRIRISSLQLDMEEGIGDPNVSTDTSMWMSWSKDGGHVYSDEISRSAGDSGDYKRRLMWRRLGHARNWTFKLRTWTPNPHVLKGLYAKLYGESRQAGG